MPDNGADKSIPAVSVATTSLSAKPVLPDRSVKKQYKQRVLTYGRPGGPTQPASSVHVRPVAPEPANEDFEDPKGKQLSVEELQLKCKEQWQRYFPWLLISENKDGRPCMRCNVCMVFGDPNYKYGRNGDGGIDIQKLTIRKHHHSLKHEAAVLRKEERDGVKKVQKSIADFHRGDADVDATHVLPMVHNTTLLLRTRYLDCDDESFGQGGDALGPFLNKHASGEFCEVLIAGTASDGTSVSHRYRLHEEKIKGQKSGVDHQACLELAREFITTLVGRLDYRLKDLSHLDGAKLLKQGSYPKNQAKRERRLGQWLQSLRNMFKKKTEDPDTLPGALNPGDVLL
ncbi:unnamed protein product [Closterium sp. Yama58-4]|nr:unnamed protein product [Closterium sp. Yama58-4]